MSAEFSKLYQAIVSDNQMVYTELRNSNTDVNILLKETVKHSEDTLLHVAANWNRRQIAEIIIDLQPSLLFATNAKGETPLHAAASAGSEDVTLLIMGQRHQIEVAETGETILRRKTENEKDTALHKAVRNRHLGVVKLLINKDPELTKLVNKDGDSPLFMAVDTWQGQITRTILTVSDCSLKGRKNMNALHAAIVRHRYYSAGGIVSCLIQKREAGVLKQQDEEFGWTPLHYAAYMNDTQTIQQLVSVEHSLAFIKDSQGMTALHIAAKQGHIRAVEKLVQICPEICGIVDDKGQSFFHIAVKSGRIGVVRFILGKRYNLLFDLLSYIFFYGLLLLPHFCFGNFPQQPFAANFLNMQDYQGNSALHLAVLEQHFFILSLLAMDRRFSKPATNTDGLTVLDIFLQSQPAVFVGMRGFLATLITGGVPGINYLLGRLENKKSEEEVDKSWDLRQINLLVSTIIATVSFTAVLSVPGGFKGGQGTAELAKNTDFHVFVICNAIAFGLSATSIILSRYIPRLKTTFDNLNLVISQVATMAMVVAFVYGTCAVLGPSKLATYVKHVTWVCLSLVFFAPLLALVVIIIIER